MAVIKLTKDNIDDTKKRGRNIQKAGSITCLNRKNML